jgi:nucleoside-diphosphate-sugar epimerase
MVKILVTGCAGFIGSNLTEKLLSMGNIVTGIDVLSNYYSVELKEKNLECLKQHNNFNFINEDILKVDLSSILNGIQYVFHLAAQPGVRGSWGSNFEIYVKNNILATQKLLEVAISSKIKKFIYASSSSIYGDQKKEKLSEDTIPKPVSPYGVSKLAAEHLCSLYYRNYGVPVVMLRLFTVFGPRQRPDMAFQILIDSIKNNSVFKIYGNGEQKRDFTYINNVTNAFILAMEKGVCGEIYNIGGGKTISLNNVIKLFEEILQTKISIKYLDNVKGDVKNTYADIEKAKSELGYDNSISLAEAIRKQLAFNSL